MFPWLLVVSSALLLAFSFNGPRWSWLAFLGLVPFFYALTKLKIRSFFGAGVLFGFLFFGGTATWIFNVFPGGLAGANNGSLFSLFLFLSWFLHALAAALPIAAFSVLAGKVFRESAFRPWQYLFGLPSAWILSEYLRAWIFTVINLGRGSLWGAHWTFGHLGYAASSTPLLPLAKFIGLYGLGWLVLYVNVLLIFLLMRPGAFRAILRNLGTVVTILIVLWFWNWRFVNDGRGRPPIRVIVVQTDSRFTHAPYRIGVAETFHKIRESSTVYNQPDVILFPEYFLLFSVIGEEERALLKTIFPDQERPGLVVTSATEKEGAVRRKNILYIDHRGKVLGKQTKTLLMPGGEFLPYLSEFILRLSGKGRVLEWYSGQALDPGARSAVVVKSGGVSFGGETIYGVVSPTIYSNLARQGAEILLNPASFTAFRSFPPFLEQMTRMARVQAAKTSRPLLQAADSGYSFVIDQEGRVIRRAPGLGNFFIEAEVTPGSRITPAVRFGEWMLGLSAVLLFFHLWLSYPKDKMKMR